MGYKLGAGISYCVTQGHTIFLDLAQDRYLRAPPPVISAYHALIQRDFVQHEALESLVRRGILTAVDGESEISSPPRAAIPTWSMLDRPYRRTSLRRLSLAALARVGASWSLRSSRLESIVSSVATMKATARAAGSAPDGDDLEAIVAAFTAIEMLLPSRDKCLSRSLALVRILARYRLYPDWVIGVRSNPFLAHSWVQHGDCVLNDSVDHVRVYTPILVV